MSHRSALISLLCWVCLFLGFHTLGLYAHNDAVTAFGSPSKQILIQPLAHYVPDLFRSYIPGFSSARPLSPSDVLAAHALSLASHTTVLIVAKGLLDSRGSSIIPDKHLLDFSFPCDGPGRGGTCDSSSWDSFYLALFWLLNLVSWFLFVFHWRELTFWSGTPSSFSDSASYLTGFFRDYLWFNSSPVICGYTPLGTSSLSVFAWLFLAAHLVWSTGFMFLISWRGYWQELIDTILFLHLATPFVYDIWSSRLVSPVALSIVQARFLGLVHFSVGVILTYPPYAICATL
jgi:photosystem I P700 chlorophyll a apoprotein A2